MRDRRMPASTTTVLGVRRAAIGDLRFLERAQAAAREHALRLALPVYRRIQVHVNDV
jgi:hypothetical protein